MLSLPLWAAVPVTLAAAAAHLVVGSASFDGGVVVDLVYPTLAALAGFVVALGLRSVGEARARRRMGEVLTQYVPPAVAAQLLDRDGGGALPSGTITFLFSDVVGSTALWESNPKEMSRAMRLHDALVEAAVQAAGGALVRPRGEGDSRLRGVRQPARGGAGGDRHHPLPGRGGLAHPLPIRVRMALHTGEAQLWEGDYYGSPPNRCARIRAVAEPGQVLLSSTTAAAVGRDVPEGTSLRPLGPVALKDFDDPEEPHELVIGARPKRGPARWIPSLVEPGPAE